MFYALVKKGGLSLVKTGRRSFVHAEELDDLLDERIRCASPVQRKRDSKCSWLKLPGVRSDRIAVGRPVEEFSYSTLSVEACMADHLRSWDSISNRRWPTLLIGNGVSINIWSSFAYPRLLERSQLNSAARRLFQDFGTTNFEVVLEALWHAERTLDALDRSSIAVRTLYEHVQARLVEAVHCVHVPWKRLPPTTLDQVASVLTSHRRVFTLNYDLLTYWAAMREDASRIKDFFWGYGHTFDINDAELLDGCTGLHFLHGGVHLWRDATTGRTGKWTARSGGGLLSTLGSNFHAKPNRHPLFVSEGTSVQKMAVIRRSDYLTFALQTLIEDRSNTVIFGASFGPQDDHVVQALSSGRKRHIAVSIRPGTRKQTFAAMARYQERLAEHELIFFDSTTHPLGDPGLSIG